MQAFDKTRRRSLKDRNDKSRLEGGSDAGVCEMELTACRDCPLQDCDSFRPHSAETLQFLQQFKQGEAAFGKGETVLAQGGKAPHLHTVLAGLLIRFRSLEDGRRQIVNFMFPGDLVGLQGAFDDDLAHSVEALIAARLCVFPRNDFYSLMRSHPELGYDVVWLAAKEETALEEHLTAVGQRTARERVAYLAVWLLDRALATGIADQDNRLDLPITQAQIADMLGLSLVHTNRTLKSLREEGLVEWTPGELRVADMDAACEYAQYSPTRHRKRPFI